MRLTKSLLCGISALALATGAAFAGEDSTHRWHGTGAEFHQTIGGLELFSDADAAGSEQFSQPMLERDALAFYNDSYSMSESDRLFLSEPDVIYVYPIETIVLVPSVDTELSLGG